MIKILYGVAPYHVVDITLTAIRNLVRNNIIHLPRGDENRAYLFGDPIPGVVKNIIYKDDHDVETVVGPDMEAYIDLVTQKIYITDVPQHIKDNYK